MLTPRSMLVTVLIVSVASLGGAFWNILQPPDSDGRASDTYGTRAHGYRAVLELLEELDVPATRNLGPPDSNQSVDNTIVLLEPAVGIVALAPKYLHELRNWIEAGGRLIVASSTTRDETEGTPTEVDGPTVFEALGLPEITLSSWDVSEPAAARSDDGFSVRTGADVWAAATAPAKPPDIIEIECRGRLEVLAANVGQIAVPRRDEATTFDYGSYEPTGVVIRNDWAEDQATVLASFKVERGEVIVVAEPRIFSNQTIALADNSVLVTHLVAGGSNSPRAVNFDEFYHGLGVRGNPLYLLTRPAFATVAVGFLLAVVVGTWRAAVFLGPPITDTGRPRRDIRAYIDAMGRFFLRGRGSRRFLVKEVRDGVLRSLCEQLHLPLDTRDVDRIAQTLARRAPGQAEALAATHRDVEALLNRPGELGGGDSLTVMQRMFACLS